uniref:Uncharacterized protein n=2 Tax=Oryza TaxID=4527 RepID=A0A0D3EW41_9ORYZ
MAIAADGEADAEVDAKTPSTITGEKTPSIVTGAETEDFLRGDAIDDTTHVASDSSSPDDNPSDIRPPSRDSDGDHSGSATISPASRSGRGRRVTTVYNEGSNRIRARIILISVPFLFLVCSPPLLRRHSGDPLALLWTIALLMCTHLFFLISSLSRTMRPSTVFFRVSYGVLVAVAADTFAGPDAGFAVMHLATGWTAGLLGYAYAEHLQHIGKETTAKNMAPPTFLTEEEKSSFKVHRRSVAAFFTLLSLAVATAGALLVKMPPPALSLLVTILSILEGIAIYCWAIFTAKFLLFEAFVSVHQLGYMLCYIGPYLLLSSILCVPLSCLVLAGDAIGAMFFWFVMMAIAGLLGYMLAVRVQYNKMVLPRLPVEQSRDEDGLQQVWS